MPSRLPQSGRSGPPPYRRESIATDEATMRYFILIAADWLGCQKKQDGGRIEPDEVPHILASAK